VAGILGGDKVCITQHLPGTRRQIVKIPDWSRNDK
jgi:hypothetical protein